MHDQNWFVNKWRRLSGSECCHELAETNDKIIDIAQNCGYENVSYFIRRFRRTKGMTPVQYREMSK